MASSLYSNSQHVSFESVLTMEDPGMISMFRALIASGLEGFLGCPVVIFESELVEFFNNGSVQDGLVVSTVNGVSIEISEQLLAETFELPVDGLSELSEMPKDKIFDARSIVSLSGEPVSLSGGKNQMKIEFRLLCDIMAKAIFVKAGSFNAITVEKFSLITAIVCGVRMNWAKILFNILKKMVTPGSKQAKGFAVQISLLLESFHNLELGESSEFPSSKILTDKTIQRYITIIDKSVVVAQEAIPILSVPVSPAVVPMVEDQQAEFRNEQPAVEVPAEETRCSSADDVDFIIQQCRYNSFSIIINAAVSSLPSVSPDISAALADFQAILSEQINESHSGISSRLHKIEQGFRDSLHEQAAVVKKLFQEACQEGRSIDDVQTMRFNEFRKNILAQNASIFFGLADVRKEVQEVNAKVDIMASRVNDVQKDVEATKEALSHQLFEFQSQAQENHNILHAHLSELVAYIHRGSADKKGESGSRGLQQPSNVQIEGSAVRPTFAQRVEIAQRHIVQTVLDADSNRELLERQAAAERDRERRRREARMLKRRRRD
ncbi:dystroglycan-like [Dorcoceras hygrometricum]|uniref:Dystroglycan-like n=1 Tax=Dorcoceras hygrometricum TaxID=472368 RepID=A0A2Z7D6T3_9LAMI|nr:dystroglycan-like [Dorcoceras hygrometricum]